MPEPTSHEPYMRRCLQLAALAGGRVAPNPQVGAVLVHNNRIIGEGYHQLYGAPHAEVLCLASVAEKDRPLIQESTLYVSLEPCAHHGKTPPCADLVIRHRIPRVVVGTRDPFSEVDGRGIEKLKSAGVEVLTGILENECQALNRRFFCFQQRQRPYIILKWARTADGIMGSDAAQRLLISNPVTQRLVHKWRSEEAAILTGYRTALLDDPSLDVRCWKGPNPVRLILDPHLHLPGHLRVFSDGGPTIVFNTQKHHDEGPVRYYRLNETAPLLPQVLDACFQMKIQSVLVEGGARTLQSFIDGGYWDEARVITNDQLYAGRGLAAPVLAGGDLLKKEMVVTDSIAYFANNVDQR